MHSDDTYPVNTLEEWEIAGLVARAERLALCPIEAMLHHDEEAISDLAKLALETPKITFDEYLETGEAQPANKVMWHCGLYQTILAMFSRCLSNDDRDLLKGIFSHPENLPMEVDYHNPNVSASALLHDLMYQLGEKAVINGWVIAIAEDFGRFTWLAPDRFEPLRYSSERQEYSLPHHDWYSVFSLCAEFERDFGASHIWYVFAKDLLHLKETEHPPEVDTTQAAQPHQEKKPNEADWKPIAESHEIWAKDGLKGPYVKHVVCIVMEEGISTKAAAERVVDSAGHSPRGKNHKQGTVVGQTYENAVENISRPACKILKTLREKGFPPNYSQ